MNDWSVLQWVMFAFAAPTTIALIGYTVMFLFEERRREPDVTYRVWVPDDDPRRQPWHKIP